MREGYAGDRIGRPAGRQGEDGEEEQRRHHRRRDGLRRDLEEAPDLLEVERPEAEPVDRAAAARPGNLVHRQECPRGLRRHHTAGLRPGQGRAPPAEQTRRKERTATRRVGNGGENEGRSPWYPS